MHFGSLSTRGGRWRPACFFELAHSAGPGSHPPAGGGGGGGGGQRFSRFANYYLKNNKTWHHTQTDIWDRFWTTLVQIPVAEAKISGSEAKCHWYLHRTGFGTGPDAYLRLGTRIGRFPKLSHNQHPAGSHSKSRAGLFASSKKHAGRKYRRLYPLNGGRALLRRRGDNYYTPPATFLLREKLFTQTRDRATSQSKAHWNPRKCFTYTRKWTVLY